MRIAIIPARSGSKRIPQKNIAEFAGQPMLAYPLQAVAKSGLFDKVHVSTDSESVAAVSKKLGYEVDFLRPAEISDDKVPVLDVARYVLREYKKRGQDFESFCMLMPCSPLIQGEDLLQAYKIFEENGSKIPVLSVCKFPSPPEWAFSEKKNDGIIEPWSREMLQVRSQDLQRSFFDTGNFSIQNSSLVLKDHGAVAGQFYKYEIPLWRSVDIDDPRDWDYALKLYKLNFG